LVVASESRRRDWKESLEYFVERNDGILVLVHHLVHDGLQDVVVVGVAFVQTILQ
jgi:hypothetical protein